MSSQAKNSCFPSAWGLQMVDALKGQKRSSKLCNICWLGSQDPISLSYRIHRPKSPSVFHCGNSNTQWRNCSQIPTIETESRSLGDPRLVETQAWLQTSSQLEVQWCVWLFTCSRSAVPVGWCVAFLLTPAVQVQLLVFRASETAAAAQTGHVECRVRQRVDAEQIEFLLRNNGYGIHTHQARCNYGLHGAETCGRYWPIWF